MGIAIENSANLQGDKKMPSRKTREPGWLPGACGKMMCILLGFGCLSLVLSASACNSSRVGHTISPGAQKQFLQAMRPPSGETARLLQNANTLKMLGRGHLAVKELEEASQRDPGNAKVADALAQCYEELGAYERAQELYQAALNHHPGNQALANNLCFSYYQAGLWEKAEACFREAVKRDPANAKARNNLGLLLVRQGRQSEALALWQQHEGEAGARQRLSQSLASLGLAAPLEQARRQEPAPAPPTVSSTPAPSPVGAEPGPRQPAPSAQGPVPAPVAPARGPEKTPVAQTTPSPVPLAASEPKSAALQGNEQKSTVIPIKPKPPGEIADAKPSSPSPALSPTPAVVKPVAMVAPQAAIKPAVPKKPATTNNPAAPGKAKAAIKSAAPAKGQVEKTALPPKPPAKAKAAASPAAPSRPTPQKPEAAVATSAPATPREGHLTAKELVDTRLTVLNGNGRQGNALKHRQWLGSEGFTVAMHGNFRDFGQKRTSISYQPSAERVARHLARHFYPQADLQETANLTGDATIRVVLGRDQLARETQINERLGALQAKAEAVLAAQTPAAGPSAPAAAAKAPVSPAPAAAPEQAAGPQSVSAPPANNGGRTVVLTAAELIQTRIALRNGNGRPNLARQCRTQLGMSGFNVVDIKNHIDFGMNQTVVVYRPGSERVARALAEQFFPNARLEEAGKLQADLDVKVILGKDLQQPELLAHLVH